MSSRLVSQAAISRLPLVGISAFESIREDFKSTIKLMDFVTGPTWDQTFGIRDARRSVLDHVALDTAVVAVAVGGVATAGQVDRDHAVTPEDVRSECGRAGRLVVAGLCDQVGLEEIHASSREFENFREVGGGQFLHLHQTFRRVLQDVDRAVVAGVVDRVAPSKRVNDPGEPLFPFDEGLDGTAGQRLNRGSHNADRKSRVAGAGRRGQLDGHRRIDGGSAINGVANQVGQGLPEPVRHFLRDVPQSVVDGGRQGQR